MFLIVIPIYDTCYQLSMQYEVVTIGSTTCIALATIGFKVSAIIIQMRQIALLLQITNLLGHVTVQGTTSKS